VLVVPYTVDLDGSVRYALFRRSAESGAWQALRGTARRGETPLDGARHAAAELAAVPADAVFFALDSRAAIEIAEASCHVAEYAFGVRVCDDEVDGSRCGLEHRWVAYDVADGLLHCAADRNALFELRRRLGRPATCC
jgi:hypothetical protein